MKMFDFINPRKVRSIHIQECDKLNEELFDCKSLSEDPTDDAESEVSDYTRETEEETSDNSSETIDSDSQSDWIVNDDESTDDCNISSSAEDGQTESCYSNDLNNREGRNDSGFISQMERYASDTSEEREGETDVGNIEYKQICRRGEDISRAENGEASINTESFDHNNRIPENENVQTYKMDDYDGRENNYLNFLAKNVQKYQLEKLCVIKCSLSDGDVLAVRKMMGNCPKTLKCIAIQQKQIFPCSDSPIVSSFIMSKFTLLTSLHLHLCESLPHEDMIRLTKLLERNLGLEQVILADIECALNACQDYHEFSFAEHKNLENVHFSSCDLLVSDVYSKKLQVCKVGSRNPTVVRNIMFSISMSDITVFHLELVHFGRDDILFPYLPCLKEVKFEKVEMTQASWLSFISKLPRMTLRDIEIRQLTLSQEVWNRFIQEISKLQQSVHVDTYDLRVRKFQSLLSFYDDPNTEVTEEARQYVKEKGLCVVHDNYDTFEFERK